MLDKLFPKSFYTLQKLPYPLKIQYKTINKIQNLRNLLMKNKKIKLIHLSKNSIIIYPIIISSGLLLLGMKRYLNN